MMTTMQHLDRPGVGETVSISVTVCCAIELGEIESRARYSSTSAGDNPTI